MPLRHLLLLFFVAISICNAGGLSAQPLATPDSAIASDAYSASLLLSRYIRFASVTGHEREAGEWLSGFCEVQGLAIQRFSREEGSYAFAASLYPLATDKPNVVLESHIDVVDAGDPSRWVHPPFAGLIVNDTLWGRGAIDEKAQTVMQLEALLRFLPEARAHDLPFNVTLLCVGGEETTSAGARLVASKFWDKLNAVVVIGEGGSGVSNLPVSARSYL